MSEVNGTQSICVGCQKFSPKKQRQELAGNADRGGSPTYFGWLSSPPAERDQRWIGARYLVNVPESGIPGCQTRHDLLPLSLLMIPVVLSPGLVVSVDR